MRKGRPKEYEISFFKTFGGAALKVFLYNLVLFKNLVGKKKIQRTVLEAGE